MNQRFKIILAVRFFGYLIFFIGMLSIIFMLGPVLVAETRFRIDKALGVKRTVPNIITSNDSATFAAIQGRDINITPVSTEYGIVIEKINANARVIPNVNPANEREYVQVLSQGVAEAAGSTPPGQPGNLYLFSHSTDAPWNIIRYNAVFYLLKELEKGDRVIVFYQDKRYDYVVFDKVIAQPGDVSYITNSYDSPVLTLQTCDPPGTLFRRLIIRARLATS